MSSPSSPSSSEVHKLLLQYQAVCLSTSCPFPSFPLSFSILSLPYSLSSFQASYASSDLYNLNGLSSSRNTGSAFNGYQVCIQTNATWPYSSLWRETIEKRIAHAFTTCSICSLVNLILTPNFILCCSSTGHSVRSPSRSIVGLVPVISSLPFVHSNLHAVINDTFYSLTTAF